MRGTVYGFGAVGLGMLAWIGGASAVPVDEMPAHCRRATPEQVFKFAPASAVTRKLDEVLDNGKGSLEALSAAANAALDLPFPVQITFYREKGEGGLIVSPAELARRLAASLDHDELEGLTVGGLSFGAETCGLRARLVRRSTPERPPASDPAAVRERLAELERRIRAHTGIPVVIGANLWPEEIAITPDYGAVAAAVVESLRKRPDVVHAHPNWTMRLGPVK